MYSICVYVYIIYFKDMEVFYWRAVGRVVEAGMIVDGTDDCQCWTSLTAEQND